MGSDDTITRLRILIGHWVEHNREHRQEFREWAGRAAALGESAAAGGMDRAGQHLSRVLERLQARGA